MCLLFLPNTMCLLYYFIFERQHDTSHSNHKMIQVIKMALAIHDQAVTEQTPPIENKTKQEPENIY